MNSTTKFHFDPPKDTKFVHRLPLWTSIRFLGHLAVPRWPFVTVLCLSSVVVCRVSSVVRQHFQTSSPPKLSGRISWKFTYSIFEGGDTNDTERNFEFINSLENMASLRNLSLSTVLWTSPQKLLVRITWIFLWRIHGALWTNNTELNLEFINSLEIMVIFWNLSLSTPVETLNNISSETTGQNFLKL